MEVADFDRDGLLDIASMETVASWVEILRGAGERRFVLAAEDAVAGNPQGLVAADLNGDGFADLATSGYAPSGRDLATEFSILLNAAGEPALAPERPRPAISLTVAPRRISAERRVRLRFRATSG